MLNKLQHFSKGERILLYCAWLITLALFTHAGMTLYFYSFYQKNPIVYTDSLIPLVNQRVKPGDSVTSITRRCSKDEYDVHVIRQVVNGIVFQLPDGFAVIPKGCTEIKRMLFTVPSELDPGTYHSESTVEVPIRWLYFSRVDSVHIKTQTFTVYNPKVE